MTRQIVLDTETTGLEASRGHRIVEIGAVELVDRALTGRTFHTYLNPDRAIDEDARKVTGIEDEFLLDKPHFGDIATDFLTFIEGGELVIHNAPFDVGFLNAELARLEPSPGTIADHASVLDTLVMARDRYPGQRNSLDALCRRLDVDNTRRDLHGGLLDAQLLAEVYLALTAGQTSLDLGFAPGTSGTDTRRTEQATLSRRPRVRKATAEELVSHEARMDAIDKACGDNSVWRREIVKDA